MRPAFREWLERQPYTDRTRATQLTQANRLEGAFGDLDAAYDQDKLVSIRSTLEYSKADQRAERPNPAPFAIDGDVYSNLAGYRATLTYFGKFREDEAGGDANKPRDLDMKALEQLRKSFLAACPDFPSQRGFEAELGRYWIEERSYKDIILERAAVILADPAASLDALGERMLTLVRQPPANFIDWRTLSTFDSGPAEARAEVFRALGGMLASEADAADAADQCAADIYPILGTGSLRTLVTTVLAFARPEDAMAVKTRYIERVVRQLTGAPLFKEACMTGAEYAALLALAGTIFAIMRDDWGWAPRDLWDVQGFLWVASNARNEESDFEETSDDMTVAAPQSVPAAEATNLILYGPPGTGKTYATAHRAVAICDGAAPASRAAVMERYHELTARKRISFVTFHQSYAYEDFVEGLRPDSGADTDSENSGAGFSLKPHPGVFRRIADLARDNHGKTPEATRSWRDRQVFKMSLGRSGQEEGSRIFREAIEGGYVALGWGGDIDWSDPRYKEFSAIFERWREDHPEATGYDSNVKQLYALRSWMTPGDLVIISDGNSRFRAIAEITGDYQFVPGDQGEFNHRRPVRWLWRNDQGLPRELIYGRGFIPVSTYNLDPSQIDWPALEQIIAGGGEAAAPAGAPEPYVLIIDEINRANISKVFGELITLLEPDKREGAPNAVAVTLPYSGDTFSVPANLHVIGTMNTADRSIALLDTALRRRFEFEELLPDPSSLVSAAAACGVDLPAVLTGLNHRIEYLFDRDHQIGHAFFISCRSQVDVDRAMRTRVIPLLSEYFYENWEKVRLVLGETRDEGAFIVRTRLRPPSGTDSLEADDGRWRYTVRSAFDPSAYEQLKA